MRKHLVTTLMVTALVFVVPEPWAVYTATPSYLTLLQKRG
jgi:hypothetical protein